MSNTDPSLQQPGGMWNPVNWGVAAGQAGMQQVNAELSFLQQPLVLVALGAIGTLVLATAMGSAYKHRAAIGKAGKAFLLA